MGVLRLKKTCQLIVLISFLGLLLLTGSDYTEAQISWFKFTMPWDDNQASFLDYPDTGPISAPLQVNDTTGHLNIRLFGINYPGQGGFPSSTQASATADRLAKLGFNFVKFTLADLSLIEVTDPETLSWSVNETEREDLKNFISELNKRGIYVGLQIISRQLIDKFGQPRPAVYFDEDLIQLQKDIIAEIITPLATNPGLGLVQYLNEIYFVNYFRSCGLHTNSECGGTGATHVTQTQSQTLDEEWNKRLLNHYGDKSSLKTAWEQDCSGKIALNPEEDPDPNGDGDGTDGTVERLLFKNRDNYCPKRVIDTVTFYYQLAEEHVNEMFNFIQSKLTYDIPITFIENFWGMPTKFFQNNTNVMAQHVPWLHPGGWQPSFQYWNAPMVNGPVDNTPPPPGWPDWIEFKNTIWKIVSTTVVEGKPFILGEYNHPLPNEFHPEFPLLISAYGSFQDWDGIVLHEYGHPESEPSIDHAFELIDDPSIMAQIPAAARIFRNEWVSPGNTTITVPFWEDGEFDGDPGMLDDWLECRQKHYCYWEKKGVNPAWSLVHQVRSDLCSSSTGCSSNPPTGTLPDTDFLSDPELLQHELHWNMDMNDDGVTDDGLVTINTSQAQGAIGFVNSQPQVGPPAMKISANLDTDFAAISLIPLDNSPLDASNKLLLTAASRVMNTGMSPEPPNPYPQELTFNSWGGAPVLLQPVTATVTLTLPQASKIAVYVLNSCGQKDSKIFEGNEQGDKFTFNIGNTGVSNPCVQGEAEDSTLWYGIEVVESDTTAPALITDFTTKSKNEQCTVNWTNPEDGDLAQVVIRRKVSSYPSDHTDGDLVYETTSPTPGENVNYEDSELTNGKTYYYAAFSSDTANNWNDTVTEGSNAAKCTPQQPGLAVYRVTKVGDIYTDQGYYCGLANQDACFQAGAGADVAEYIRISEPVEPGDVVAVDIEKPGYYRKSRKSYSTLVTGVISSTPGITMRRLMSDSKALLALLGVVPVKVTAENGPIQPGDLLVSSSTPGYAMLCTKKLKCEGAFIGKALESLEKGKGKIKALIMR